MTVRNVSNAKEQLSDLLVMVEGGEDVIIARAGKPVARLVKFERPAQARRPGAMKGKIWIAEDFNAPDPELERQFLEGSIEPAA